MSNEEAELHIEAKTFARQLVFLRCTEVLWDDPSKATDPVSPDATLHEEDDAAGFVPVASLPR